MTGGAPLPDLDRDMTAASDEQLLRVVGLIDTLDQRGPVDHLLAPVRARLALLRPPRPITLGRVLILPFEDLLVAPDEAWPGRRCFSRAHLGWLVEQVTTELPVAMVRQLRAHADGHSMIAGDVVREVGATLWPAAAEIAGAKLADDHLASDVREQLAGMVPLLALGRTLVPAVWQLPPRPMGVLARPALDHLLEAIRAAVPLGEAATLSVLELLLARAASPIVVLEPLRAAHLGLTAGAREKLLGQVVQRRIADMRAARLAAPGGVERRSSTAALLRLVADLDALEGKWPVSAGDRASLAEVRSAASAFVGVGIDSAVCGQILAPLEALAQPDGLSDEGVVEQLEETARHTRRLGIAGAKLGLAANADALLGGFLPRFQERIRANGPGAMAKSGLIDQIRIVEILFGSDAAIQLYEELIGGRSKLSAG